MSRSPRTSGPWGGLAAGVAVVGACLVCCAAPVLSVLGAVAALSAVAAVWIPALAVLAVIAAAVGVWVWRRRQAATCTSSSGPVDLGMPTQSPSEMPDVSH